EAITRVSASSSADRWTITGAIPFAPCTPKDTSTRSSDSRLASLVGSGSRRIGHAVLAVAGRQLSDLAIRDELGRRVRLLIAPSLIHGSLQTVNLRVPQHTLSSTRA